MFQEKLRTTTITVDRAVSVQVADEEGKSTYTPRAFMGFVCSMLRANAEGSGKFITQADLVIMSTECIDAIQNQVPSEPEYLLFAMLGVNQNAELLNGVQSYTGLLGNTPVFSMQRPQGSIVITAARLTAEQAVILLRTPQEVRTYYIAAGPDADFTTPVKADYCAIRQMDFDSVPTYQLFADAVKLTLNHEEYARLRNFLTIEWREIEIAYTLGYHVTYRDNLDAIMKDGLIPGEDGAVGPGVYLWTEEYPDVLAFCLDHLYEELAPIEGFEDSAAEDAWIQENCTVLKIEHSGRVMRVNDNACCVVERVQPHCIQEVETWFQDWQALVTGKATELF